MFSMSIEACNFIKKKTPTQVFSCKLCEIFKKNYFYQLLYLLCYIILLSYIYPIILSTLYLLLTLKTKPKMYIKRTN